MSAVLKSPPPSKTHVSLYISGVERSTAFYAALFGCAVHMQRPGYAEFDLTDPPLRLVLQEAAHAGAGPVNHLGVQFASPEALQAARERLVSGGHAVREVPDTTCRLPHCPPRYDTIWASAPDGCRWELYAEIPQPNGPTDSRRKAN